MPKKMLEDNKKYYTHSTRMVRFQCHKCGERFDESIENEQIAARLMEEHLKYRHKYTNAQIICGEEPL